MYTITHLECYLEWSKCDALIQISIIIIILNNYGAHYIFTKCCNYKEFERLFNVCWLLCLDNEAWSWYLYVQQQNEKCDVWQTIVNRSSLYFYICMCTLMFSLLFIFPFLSWLANELLVYSIYSLNGHNFQSKLIEKNMKSESW